MKKALIALAAVAALFQLSAAHAEDNAPHAADKTAHAEDKTNPASPGYDWSAGHAPDGTEVPRS